MNTANEITVSLMESIGSAHVEEIGKIKIQLKSEIVSLIEKIKENKAALKAYQRENNGYAGMHYCVIYRLQKEFRRKHIIASLLRGKTMEQIESSHTTYGDIDPNCPEYLKGNLVNPPDITAEEIAICKGKYQEYMIN